MADSDDDEPMRTEKGAGAAEVIGPVYVSSLSLYNNSETLLSNN